jgi:iron complex transport system substrate-binding protein
VDPEMLILMPCGFHLEDGLEAWRRTPRPAFWDDLDAVRDGRVYLVDGSAYFSRPGPRVIDGVELLAELFDPEGLAGSAPGRSWTRAD